MNVTTKVTTDGPFFKVDPRKTFRANARVMLQAVADEGEKAVKSRSPYYTGSKGDPNAHIRDFIKGRVKSLSGKPWAMTAVVSSLFHFYNTQNGRHYGYGRKLEARTKFFRRGIATVRPERREAEKLLRGLQ